MRKIIVIFFIYFIFMTTFSIIPYERMMFERSFLRGKDFSTQITSNPVSVGDTQNFWVLDSSNSYVEKSATCKKIGTYSYVFLQSDKTVDQDKIDILVERFEKQAGIRERLREKFGTEFSPGIDVDDKIYILLCDMGTFGQSHYATDDSLSGTADKRFPIDAYYSYLDELPQSVFSSSNQKEIIYINTDLFRFFPDNEIDFNPVPNVLAREYFRMIHFNEDYISNNLGTIGSAIPENDVEKIWVDYGLAFYASKIGTGQLDMQYIEAVTRRPFNSFVMFEESLANIAISDSDLAMSGLFFMYLDQIKGSGVGNNDLMKNITQEKEDGIAAIDSKITGSVIDVANDFLNAIYIDDSNIASKYDIYGVDINAIKYNLVPDDTSYTCPDYDYYISPSIYMEDISKLKMGSSIAFSVKEIFWPQKYVSMKFNELQGADKLKVKFLVLDQGELVKAYDYSVDSFENLITWNDIYAAGDELQIIISDISNGLVQSGDYNFDYYVPGETEEVFINRYKQYISRVSKSFQLDFVKPNMKMSVFPSPFTQDFLNAVIISEGQVNMKLKRPDGNEEQLSLTKIKNTQDRYISVFKAEESGDYTAEVSVLFEDGLTLNKDYLFEVHEFLDGKNIIPSDRNASLVMREAPEGAKFIYSKDDNNEFRIDSSVKGDFEIDHSMQYIPNQAVFKKEGDDFKFVKGTRKGDMLVSAITEGGVYKVIRDTNRPEIRVDVDDDKVNIKIDDISLEDVIITDEKGKMIYTGNKKEITLFISELSSNITINAKDHFNNKASARFTIPKQASAAIGFCRVFPNPSSEFAEFEFSSTSSENMIKIYDVSGRHIRTIKDFELFYNGTSYSYTWLLEDRNMRQVHNGIYFYKIFVSGEERLDGKIAVYR
ncbi:MAG: hypothetical protein C0601_07165 [Candidatus Muiribacterium halophilum]|uniref:Secretion system C-terminal sorting domain-containing protein n=1 Tax=Muiribacterium halophilum TaxID=2053465 RepID=A0A2N5ZFP5_MUIH1|nr:MAG: hypothetical protein C0601_07165 [Candidatus Muirbacterium halophilum]